MNNTEKVLLILPFVIFGIILIVVGYKKKNKTEQKCNLKISARVIKKKVIPEEEEIEEEIEYEKVLEYDVNGKKYDQYISNKSLKYYEGEQVDLYVNPNDPNEFYEANSNTHKSALIGGILVTIFILSIMLLILLV